MNNRRKLMRKLQEYSFAALDAELFLDTHPDSKQAIAYFNKMNELAQKAKQEYEELYGPITIDSTCNDTWKWAKTPFPWELEG